MTSMMRSRARAIGTVLVALVVATAAGSSLRAQGDDPERVVLAEFADASPLIEGNLVKVNGVQVGEVGAMRVVDGVARVALEVGPEALPLHEDATATIRADSILGERFIDLGQGSPSAPLLVEDAVIPIERTTSGKDLQDVFNILDGDTSTSLAAMVAVLGEGIDGNGDNTRAAIEALGPAMEDTGELVRVLQEQNDTLNSLVDTMTPVADSLAANDGERLDGLLESTRALLGTTAANQDAFEATLGELPPTLTSGRATLSQLTGTAEATTPTLRAMRPTTDNLAAISAELNGFADAAEPALAAAEPVLEEGATMLREARPVAEQLRLLGPNMTANTQEITPVVAELTGNITNVMEFFKRWALTTNGRDGLGHYFRANLTIGHPEQVTGITPFGGGLGVGGEEPETGSNPGGVPVPEEDEGELPELPIPNPDLRSGLLAPNASTDGSATGMTQDQERAALDFLLGGG